MYALSLSFLLQDIIKNTPDTHPDHKNLVKALEIMVSVHIVSVIDDAVIMQVTCDYMCV